jgi:cytochrome b pre-mRNA-processing protein 3
MILPLFRPRNRPDTISRLYGAIVAQARLPSFYREYAVPDTVNSRFDMIVLHLTLLLERLAHEPGPRKALGQAVFDRFCEDMDANLREMGIGDLSVPRKMTRLGTAFYGRMQAYRDAIANEGPALTEVLGRTVYGEEPGREASAARLAAYMREAVSVLAKQEAAEMVGGKLRFPDPAGIKA